MLELRLGGQFAIGFALVFSSPNCSGAGMLWWFRRWVVPSSVRPTSTLSRSTTLRSSFGIPVLVSYGLFKQYLSHINQVYKIFIFQNVKVAVLANKQFFFYSITKISEVLFFLLLDYQNIFPTDFFHHVVLVLLSLFYPTGLVVFIEKCWYNLD